MGSASSTIAGVAFLIAASGALASPAGAQDEPGRVTVETSAEARTVSEFYRQIPPQPTRQLARPDAPIRQRYGDPPGTYAEILPDVYVKMKGKRARRMARFARWNQGLDGDRLSVYSYEGYPYYRHYENDGGVRTEHWTYRERGITYVFSEDGFLLETRIF